MFPTFDLFGKTIGLYPVLAVVGLLCAGWFCCRQAARHGQNTNDMIALLLIASVGVLAGGHLLYALVSYRYLAAAFKTTAFFSKDMLALLYGLFGGSVFYGGLMGGLTLGLLYAKRKRIPLPLTTDLIAPAFPLFHTFGRVGCFLGGCCYGVEHRFGFVATRSLVEAANGVRRFPVQLAEAVFNLCLFLLLYGLLKKGAARGRLIYLYLILYAAGRFTLEFWRGDSYRGTVFVLSTSQFISLLLGLGAAVLLCLSARQNADKKAIHG